MSDSLSFSALFSGPARYRAVTPWGPWEALAMTAIAAIGPGIVLIPVLLIPMMLDPSLAVAPGEPITSLKSPLMLGAMIGTQVMSIGLIWLLAGRANMRPDALQFRQPPLGWLAAIGAGLLMLIVTGALEAAMHKIGKFDPFSESKMISEGLRSPLWWGTVLVAVVLAPIWEELAFRGFLLTALAKTRLGIIGAGLITNVLWTALHMQYSAAGLASVFAAGLFLTWLVWRTGSIRASMVAHAVGNATALAFLAAFAPA